jgi:hypothetical protein
MTNPVILTGDGCSSFELRKLSKGYAWSIKAYDPNLERGYNLVRQINKQATDDFGTELKEEE